MLLLWHIQFILVKNVSVACRVVRAAAEIIQRHVEVVREGNEDGKCRFIQSMFISLNLFQCNADIITKSGLIYVFGFPKLS